MADFFFNAAKGKWAYFATLPAANDAFIMIPLEATGLDTDANLKDMDDLATILAGTTNEQTTMGRKTVSGVSLIPDDVNDRVDVDFDDVAWVAATGNGIGALLLAYDGDTTGGTDSAIVPIAKWDFVATPNGGDITAQVPAGGVLRAS